MKFTIRDLMWAVFLACLFARWVAVDVVFRGKMVNAWRDTYIIQIRLKDRVKNLERQNDQIRLESIQMGDDLRYLEKSLHDSQTQK